MEVYKSGHDPPQGLTFHKNRFLAEPLESVITAFLTLISEEIGETPRGYSASVRGDVPFECQAGLFGFEPGFVGGALQPVVFGFRRGSDFALKIGDACRKVFRGRFVLREQPRLFLAEHFQYCTRNVGLSSGRVLRRS
jgi:hypothetical protein